MKVAFIEGLKLVSYFILLWEIKDAITLTEYMMNARKFSNIFWIKWIHIFCSYLIGMMANWKISLTVLIPSIIGLLKVPAISNGASFMSIAICCKNIQILNSFHGSIFENIGILIMAVNMGAFNQISESFSPYWKVLISLLTKIMAVVIYSIVAEFSNERIGNRSLVNDEQDSVDYDDSLIFKIISTIKRMTINALVLRTISQLSSSNFGLCLFPKNGSISIRSEFVNSVILLTFGLAIRRQLNCLSTSPMDPIILWIVVMLKFFGRCTFEIISSFLVAATTPAIYMKRGTQRNMALTSALTVLISNVFSRFRNIEWIGYFMIALSYKRRQSQKPSLNPLINKDPVRRMMQIDTIFNFGMILYTVLIGYLVSDIRNSPSRQLNELNIIYTDINVINEAYLPGRPMELIELINSLDIDMLIVHKSESHSEFAFGTFAYLSKTTALKLICRPEFQNRHEGVLIMSKYIFHNCSGKDISIKGIDIITKLVHVSIVNQFGHTIAFQVLKSVPPFKTSRDLCDEKIFCCLAKMYRFDASVTLAIGPSPNPTCNRHKSYIQTLTNHDQSIDEQTCDDCVRLYVVNAERHVYARLRLSNSFNKLHFLQLKMSGIKSSIEKIIGSKETEVNCTVATANCIYFKKLHRFAQCEKNSNDICIDHGYPRYYLNRINNQAARRLLDLVK